MALKSGKMKKAKRKNEKNTCTKSLLMSSVKPHPASGSAFLVNLNQDTLLASVHLRDTTLPPNASWSVSPASFELPPGQIVQLEVEVDSAGLMPRNYNLTLTITAETPTSLPIELELPVSFTFTAKADPQTTHVSIESSPTLDVRWAGVSIVPYDVDGFAITSDENEDFELSLASNNLSSSCSVRWMSLEYIGECIVPNTGLAGAWKLQLALNGGEFFTATVHASCPKDTYETPFYRCESCPRGSLCSQAGTTLATLSINLGYWRTGELN